MAPTLTEHYRYLSLAKRTEAYRKALEESGDAGKTVADLGCGRGILGLLALQQGAARCSGIDHSPALEIARETMEREGFSEKFEAIRASTFDTDLLQRADLLLCYHMLEDARKRMLKAAGTIIQRGMEMHIALVESGAMRNKISRWRGAGIHTAYHWLGEYEANTLHSRRFVEDNMLSPAQMIATVDFSEDAPALFRYEGELAALRDGTLNGICGFFSCRLSESVSLTNSPFSPEAIGRPNAFLPLRQRIRINKGERISVNLSIRHDKGIVNWSVIAEAGAEQKMTSWNSQILTRKS